MKNKILITQWIPDEVKLEFSDKFQLIYPDKSKTAYSYEELKELIVDCDALLTIFRKVDKELIDCGKNLKAIANLGVGYDTIDVNYATQKNIAIINAPNSVTESTAELTVALLMASMRNIVAYDKSMRRGEWTRSAFDSPAVEIFGHSLGIAGFGRIGKSVCKKAQAMGMKVFYYDPYPLAREDELSLDVEYMDLDQLFSKCDCISLHMPYTPENHHLVDENRFSKMKKGSFLVNAARGAIVKESALVKALNDGTLKGAALDVFEFEPSVSKELLDSENVVINPHVGTNTYQVRVNMCNETMTGLFEILSGNKPYNLVNKEINI